MPPRKSMEKSVQNVKKKVVKRGPKKKITEASAPPIIRVEIPTTSSSVSGMKTRKARVVTSQKLKIPSLLSTKISKPRIVTTPNLSENEIKVMLANEVVQAQFARKSNENECKSTSLSVKREIIPKKMMDGRTAVRKKAKPVTLTKMDSNGSAFEETSEPKQEKTKTRGRPKKIIRNPCTIDADIVKNGAAKRRHSTNSGVFKINRTNPKMKTNISQNCRMNAQVEHKLPKKNGNTKKNKTVTEIVENLPTESKLNGCEDISINQEQITSRKASNYSESLSWAKEISSSSTITCLTVSSNEYVCIDNRIPVIKLTNICESLDTNDIIVKKGETSKDIKSTDNSKDIHGGNISPTLSRSRSLSLSSSSSSSSSDSDSSSSSLNNFPTKHDTLDKSMEKLTSNMKKFDTEMMKWIRYGNEKCNSIKANIRNKLFEVLKEEDVVIVMCQNIKTLLLHDNSRYILSYDNEKDEKRDEFVKPSNVMELKSDKVTNRGETMVDNAFKNMNNDDGTTNDVVDIHPFDDDDALSLYAESISGFEPYRKTTGNLNQEYVPQPISKNVKPSQSVIYRPTKIIERKSNEDNEICVTLHKTKSICEKQNADSTSIHKDAQYNKSLLVKCSSETTNPDEKYGQSVQNLVCASTQERSEHPILMSSIYKPMKCIRSVVFGGVCYFNLNLSCKILRCRFPHAYLHPNVIEHRLTQVDEDMFIKEYMVLRCWPVIKRTYGLLFVNEAINRELTRILIEMAIDFVTKTNPNHQGDVALKVEVLERILLHLNNVDILPFAAFLSFNINNNQCIGDIFMETLAETQNFSRFKTIFINLTNLMYKIDRHFSLNVATSLLERVCILPFEEQLALALLNILKRTSPDILEKPMIGFFEKSLSPHEELFNQLQEIKNKTPSQVVATPTPPHELDQKISMVLGDLDKRCSPDTTNFDNLIKTHHDSIVTPLIDVNRTLFVQSKGLTNESPNSPISINNSVHHQNMFQRWKDKYILDKLFTPEGRPNFKRQLDKHSNQYGGSPSKIQRRFGPEFL